jgi:hypothetical protein
MADLKMSNAPEHFALVIKKRRRVSKLVQSLKIIQNLNSRKTKQLNYLMSF